MPGSISTESAAALVQWLSEMMAVTYGGLFTSRVAQPEALESWERLWKVILTGKDSARTKDIFATLFGLHSNPFTPADFNRVYREQSAAAHALALPRPRANKEKALENVAEIRAAMAKINQKGNIRRNRTTIENGTWTDEMEAAFAAHAERLGIRL